MRLSHIVLSSLLLVCAGLMVVPFFSSIDPVIARAGAVVLLAIGLWSTGALPVYLSAVIFFFLAIVLGLAPPNIVFSGFHSAAVWLVFGGLFIGFAVQACGLGGRIVEIAMVYLSGGYAQMIMAIVSVGLLLSFFIPSAVGRVVVLLPIVIALAEKTGFEARGKGYTGMVLAVGMGVTMPAFNILPSNVPNMALVGSAESVYGISFRYGDYFLLNFTVMGVLAFLIIPMLLILFFSETPKPNNSSVEVESPRWTGKESRLLLILLVTVGFWASDSLHGFSPAWVAMGAAIVCLLPGIGVMDPGDIRKINFGPWIFVAGVIGLGAVANHTGLANIVSKMLLSQIDLSVGGGFQNYLNIVGIGMGVAVLTTHPAAPAIMTPLASGLVEATGWPLVSVLMAQVPTWVVYLLPYQAPPMVVAMAMANLRLSRAMPVMVAYFAIGLVVILPAHYFWGRYLGYWP